MTTMSNSPLAPSFNLWTEPWLPLEMPDRSLKKHSIRGTLLNAHERIAIYDPSPLVVVGVHRLLVAILQDALNPQENADLENLWQHGHFLPDTIAAFEKSYADRFDLFSPDKPFLQSADLPMFPRTKEEIKESKSAAKLFAEIPTGDEVTHYRHGDERDAIFSPATAALGLLTIPPFVSSGGQGNFPSVNGAPPPIYVLPGGRTLFESLTASLLTRYQLATDFSEDLIDLVWWRRDVPIVVPETGNEKEKKEGQKESKSRPRVKRLTMAGYLHGLTFPARKIRLQPEPLSATCSRSGERTAWNIRKVVFRMGESLADDAAFWRDPFVAYAIPKAKKTTRGKPNDAIPKKKSKDKPATLKVLYERAKLPAWREFSGLFMQQRKNKSVERPRFLDQFSSLNAGEQFRKFPFRCIALHAKADAKIFEWLDFGFDVPPALLRDSDGALWTDKALNFATGCAATITRVFGETFRGSSTKANRFQRLKTRMENDFWQVMGEKFRAYVIDLGDATTREAKLEGWLNDTKHEAQAAFNRAADTTGDDGNALRHIEEGKAHCRMALGKLRNKTNQPVDSQEETQGENNDNTKTKKRTQSTRR